MDATTTRRPAPVEGEVYISKLLKFLSTNKTRLSTPPHASAVGTPVGNVWQQTWTIATLGLDPNSSPLNPTLAQVFSLGLATPTSTPRAAISTGKPVKADVKPLTLRLPPDRLLYLLLLFQSSPTSSISSSPNLGKTDIPVPPGVQLVAGSALTGTAGSQEGDVKSIQSWVGSLKSVGGVFGTGSSGRKKASDTGSTWTTWFGGAKKEAMDQDAKLRLIYAAFTILPSLAIYPPSSSDPLIKELRDEDAYTSLGGIDVRVPLNVFRSLLSLELDGYDPRGLSIPSLPSLRSLTVKGVQDGEDWLEELLTISSDEEGSSNKPLTKRTLEEEEAEQDDDTYTGKSRFPSLRHLSLPSTSLFGFPGIPCTNLTHLDLSSNLLNVIPTSLAQLTLLESVNLSNNMIESVRGVENVLANVKALNLRHNRIDCLSGLDRLQRLERIDVRRNELYESDEVGRLALCPNLKEVWVGQGNPYLEREEEWRTNVFRALAEEGKEKALLDGYEMTWTEKRTVQAELQKMGRRAGTSGGHTDHPRSPKNEGLGGGNGSSTVRTPAATLKRDPFSNAPHTMRVHHHANHVNSAEVESGQSTPLNKRRRQRIVDLDGTVRMASESDDGIVPRLSQDSKSGLKLARGSDRMLVSDQMTSEPERQSFDQESLAEAMGLEVPSKTTGSSAVSSHSRSRTTTHSEYNSQRGAGEVKKSGRGRISASVYEPAGADDGEPAEMSAEELRARMEALKTEVGDSWLRVLAGQQTAPNIPAKTKLGQDTKGEILPTVEERREPDNKAVDPEDSVVQVVKRTKKKKKAVGEIL